MWRSSGWECPGQAFRQGAPRPARLPPAWHARRTTDHAHPARGRLPLPPDSALPSWTALAAHSRGCQTRSARIPPPAGARCGSARFPRAATADSASAPPPRPPACARCVRGTAPRTSGRAPRRRPRLQARGVGGGIRATRGQGCCRCKCRIQVCPGFPHTRLHPTRLACREGGSRKRRRRRRIKPSVTHPTPPGNRRTVKVGLRCKLEPVVLCGGHGGKLLARDAVRLLPAVVPSLVICGPSRRRSFERARVWGWVGGSRGCRNVRQSTPATSQGAAQHCDPELPCHPCCCGPLTV